MVRIAPAHEHDRAAIEVYPRRRREPLVAWRTAYEIEANAAEPGPDNDADAQRWFDDAVAEVADRHARGVRRAVLFTGVDDARAAYRAVGFEIVGSYGIVLLA